jgi:hypothetical protein
MTELEQYIKDCNKNSIKNNPKATKLELDIMFSIVRDQVIQKYGFAILTENIVDKLKKYQPILEVGAGLGYWAYECQKAGLDYIATDIYSIKGNSYFSPETPRWTNIETISAKKAIIKYPTRALLMCWPDYNCNWACNSLKKYKNDYFIYVGEMCSGCCANDKFFNQFSTIHDKAIVYKRKVK